MAESPPPGNMGRLAKVLHFNRPEYRFVPRALRPGANS